MSSYFQETSSSLAPSVAASSAFNWQAIHSHHHQLQQQQMNLQPNPDIFHSHYSNLYNHQGYHHQPQKYNNSNYIIPSSGTTSTETYPPSSSLPLPINNHEAPLDHARAYLNASNDINTLHRINGNNVPENSTTTSPAATNNNVTNDSLEATSKRNYSTTSLDIVPQSLTSSPYNKSANNTPSSIPSTSVSTTISPSSFGGKLDSTNVQAAQTAAAAAAAVAAYNNSNSVLPALDSNTSESYASRMNLGFPYGGVQSMAGSGVAASGLGDPNAAAMAAVHAAAASHGCYDMYTAATMASKSSSFYPWMKNYPGKKEKVIF